MTRPTNKQIIKNNIGTNRITFICVFCFSYLAITKNHECEEAIAAGIQPKKAKADSSKKHRTFINKYGKRAWGKQHGEGSMLSVLDTIEKMKTKERKVNNKNG